MSRKNVAMADMLRAISDELTAMSRTTERLQLIMGLAWEVLPEKSEFHRDAQACDLLTQRLSATASFISKVAEDLPSTWITDAGVAASQTKLCDVVDKLLCIVPAAETAETGDVHIF